MKRIALPRLSRIRRSECLRVVASVREFHKVEGWLQSFCTTCRMLLLNLMLISPFFMLLSQAHLVISHAPAARIIVPESQPTPWSSSHRGQINGDSNPAPRILRNRHNRPLKQRELDGVEAQMNAVLDDPWSGALGQPANEEQIGTPFCLHG